MDYLSRNPIWETWPESELDENFVVASIDQFHSALDCLMSRLIDTKSFNSNVNILDHSDLRSTLNETPNTSSPGCYSNSFVQKRKKLDQNENGQNSRLCNCDQNTLNKISQCIQSVDISKKDKQRKIAAKQEEKFK